MAIVKDNKRRVLKRCPKCRKYLYNHPGGGRSHIYNIVDIMTAKGICSYSEKKA